MIDYELAMVNLKKMIKEERKLYDKSVNNLTCSELVLGHWLCLGIMKGFIRKAIKEAGVKDE